MSWSARLYYEGHRLLRGAYGLADRAWTAVGLGLMDGRDLEALDRIAYGADPLYGDASHATAGLWRWERDLLASHAPPGARYAVLGAGTGREAIDLAAGGIEVDAFETQEPLREIGNRWLAERENPLRIRPMPYSDFPETKARYDCILLGWGLLSGIAGRDPRARFLRACREHLVAEGILLASFRMGHNEGPGVSLRAANLLRKLRRRPCREPGDRLSGEFIHRFSRAGIEGEMAAAGFEILTLTDEPYPHLAARARLGPNSPETSS